jgi:Bacterial cell division membrane protein
MEDFLEVLLEQIRCKKARGMIVEEISQHIEDQKASYQDEGDDEITATEKALEQMGDPVEIGIQLNRIHKPKLEWSLLIAVLALCILGIFAQTSLGDMVYGKHLPNSVNIERHIFFLILGLLLMIVVYFLDYTLIGRYSKLICVFYLAGFFAFAIIGNTYNGSLRHIYAYGLLIIPIYGGILYAYRKNGYIGFIKCLLIGVLAFLVEKNFVVQCSVYFGILFSCLIMLSVAVMKNWFKISKKIALTAIWSFIPVSCSLLLLSGTRILDSYQQNRLETFVGVITNRGLYDYNKDYQLSRAAIIVTHAKLFGKSDALSSQYLPSFNTEYILTYVIGKWGIATGILITVLFIVIISRMISLSYRLKNSLGMILCLGCSLVFTIQSGIYILSNLGYQLLAQVNLPFVSYGGSSLIVNFIILGIMLSVIRNARILKEMPYRNIFTIKIERVK